MCHVCRHFTEGFAKAVEPLNELVSSTPPKNLPPLSRVEQTAFETFRDQLLKPLILAICRLRGHYVLKVDASYDQLGCGLLQQQCSKTEVRYLSTLKEHSPGDIGTKVIGRPRLLSLQRKPRDQY